MSAAAFISSAIETEYQFAFQLLYSLASIAFYQQLILNPCRGILIWLVGYFMGPGSFAVCLAFAISD